MITIRVALCVTNEARARVPLKNMPTADRVRLAQRHEKLRDLMTDKVVERVGRRVSEAEREYIAQEVDMLIHRGENSDAALTTIASHVRHLTPASSQVSAPPTKDRIRDHNAKPAAAPPPYARTRDSAPSTVVEAARAADAYIKQQQQQLQQQQKQQSRKLPPGLTPELMAALENSDAQASTQRRLQDPTDAHRDDLWARMAEKDVEQHNRELLEERRRAKKLEDEQRAYLDQQIALRERKVVATKVDEQKFVVEEQRQKKLWEEDIKKKEAEKKRRFAEEKASRDAQLDAARQRKAIEEARRRQEDAEAAVRDREAYEKEQELIKERKVRAKEDVVKAQQFNKHFEEVRTTEKSKEKAKDLEHQRLFLERLRKQDEERELALVKMHEKQRHQQQIAYQMQAGYETKAADDERKALEHKRKREAEELAREREVAEKAAAQKVKQRQYLMLQMIEREEGRKKDREDMETQKRRIEAELDAAERKEAERLLVTKKRNEDHRKAIEGQIVASEARHRPLYMSEAEKRLNSPILRKAGIQL
jgi:hypothetical protein